MERQQIETGGIRESEILSEHMQLLEEAEHAETREELTALKEESDKQCAQVHLRDFAPELSPEEREKLRELTRAENRRLTDRLNHVIKERELGEPDLDYWG